MMHLRNNRRPQTRNNHRVFWLLKTIEIPILTLGSSHSGYVTVALETRSVTEA